MTERFERSREASRNICDTLGMKPLTAFLVKWWEIVTTTIASTDKPDLIYVPWQGLTPATPTRTAPVSALRNLPYFDLLRGDLEDAINLLFHIEDGVGTEGLNADAKAWLSDLRETMTDIWSVCEIE